jgi:hypothetical protein
MKLFISIFLVLLLSSCSEDGDTATTDVIGSSTANNQEAIKESEKNESIVEERVEEYLNSNDISAGIDLRNNRLYFISTAIGSSRAAVRCDVYSELIGFIQSKASMNKLDNNFNPLINAYININGVKLKLESQSSIEVSEIINSGGQVSTLLFSTTISRQSRLNALDKAIEQGEGTYGSEVFNSSTSIQLSSDFGDLSFSCDQEQTTVNDKVSLVERNGYSGLSPKTKIRFTNEGDYIEAYFDHMNDLGFKEIIFESGDVVGMVLQLKSKT